MSHPSSLNASSVGSRSPPGSLPASLPSSHCASPLRTRLSQPHSFAATLKTAKRQPLAKDAECPSHYYQLDLSTLRKNAAVFGSEPKQPSARSEGGESSASSARYSARSALSEGATPRSATLLGPDFDLPLRKHTFTATSLKSSSPRFERAADASSCPVHAYSTGAPATDRAPATFGKAQTGRGLLVPLSGGTFAGPDADLLLRRGTFSCTFGSAPRPNGALHMSRSGLAATPSTGSFAPRPPPGASARPTTSTYLRRKSENAARSAAQLPAGGLTPAPPAAPRQAMTRPLAPIRRPREPAAGEDPARTPLARESKAQRVLFPEAQGLPPPLGSSMVAVAA
eukprot:Transcript_25668.p2 GENE.Transcript_25668~~Transcript_25668.p2  ORF type:complete len:341 (+),score=95.03 Transcript_25668:1241-2263(+)